jgi:hypothetical protein
MRVLNFSSAGLAAFALLCDWNQIRGGTITIVGNLFLRDNNIYGNLKK